VISLVHKSSDRAQVWDQIFDEISILSGIAKTSGSLVTLKDLAALTRTSLSEEQIRSSWETIPGLAVSYRLRNGFIIQRGNDYVGNGWNIVELEQEKRIRAEEYARYARKVASICNARGTNLLAISGSTSYQTPFASDDLDIFCVTKPDGLWLFLTKSLLLARFQQFFKKDAPRLCFSYAVDQKFAEKEFALPRDALFARDALTTMVVHGQDYYKELLKKSPWISNYFPRLYQDRTETVNGEGVARRQIVSQSGRKFLNILLRVLVGNYVTFKSAMLNMRLRKQGKFSSLFSARIGVDHCIFESVRYSKIRAVYLRLDEKSGASQRREPPAR
jgi:hypothetical protein